MILTRSISAKSVSKRRKEWLRLQLKADDAQFRYGCAVEAYLREHPLTDSERMFLVGLVRIGSHICCVAEGQLDPMGNLLQDRPLWVSVIREWAYEHLSCRKKSEDEMRREAKKLEVFLAGPVSWAIIGDYLT